MQKNTTGTNCQTQAPDSQQQQVALQALMKAYSQQQQIGNNAHLLMQSVPFTFYPGFANTPLTPPISPAGTWHQGLFY